MDVPCHQLEMEVEWSFYSTYVQFMQFDIAIAMNSTRIFKNNLSGSKNIYIKKKKSKLWILLSRFLPQKASLEECW